MRSVNEDDIKNALNAVAHVQSALRNLLMQNSQYSTLVPIEALLDGMRVGVLDALGEAYDVGSCDMMKKILTRFAEDIGADL